MKSAQEMMLTKMPISRPIFSILLILSLSACANLGMGNNNQNNGPTLAQRVSALEEMVAEYENALAQMEVQTQNNSEGLANVASDVESLQTINTRLSRLEVQVRARNAQESNVQPAEEAQAQSNMATSENGSFAVHLASYRSRETAVEGWNDMVEKYPAEMGSLTGVMSIFDVPSLGGRFFRLKAGPFRSEAQAQNFCSVLESLNEYCVVDLYDGEIISE